MWLFSLLPLRYSVSIDLEHEGEQMPICRTSAVHCGEKAYEIDACRFF